MKPWDLPKRLKEIEQVRNGKSEGTYPLIFRGTLTDFPIYKVPIEMPIYRLSNGRTIARQKEYIAKHKLPDDFFLKDPESASALEAQEEILADMVSEEGLYDYFKNPQTVQDEPIVLDKNGYIINGNRRICAMKILIQRNHEVYGKYEYVRVIFLENYNEEDIIRLEALLQIRKDIKADYSWITEALLFRSHMENLGYDYQFLERVYDQKKSDIQKSIDMAGYADEYLSSRNWKDEYSRVEKHKEAFSQLCRYRKPFRDVQDQELFKEFVFQFIDTPEDAPGRLYSTVKDIADNFEDIKKTMIEEFELKDEPTVTKKADKKYGILTPKTKKEDKDKTVTNEKIIKFVKNGKKASKVREEVVNTIILCKKRKKETKSKNAFRKNLQTAYSNLVDARTCFNSNSNLDGVTKCIENMEGEITNIKGLLK